MDIYQALKRDHRKAKDLFSKLLKTSLNERAREETFEKLKDTLESHHAAEEKIFYHALNLEGRVTDHIENAVEQHEEVVYSLEEIEEINIYDQDWQEQIAKLALYHKEHVKEEEGTIFNEAKMIFSEEQAKKLAQQFMQVKERV